MNPIDHRDVPAPSLDPVRRDTILSEVLAEPPARRTPRHRWLAPVGAAAAVGVVAVGGVALLDREPGTPGTSAGPSRLSPTATQEAGTKLPPAGRVEPFVIGSLTAAEAREVLERCLPSFGYDPSTFEVALGQRVAGPHGREDVVIAADRVSGTQFFCGADDMSMIAGPDSKSVVRVPDAAHPLTPADVGGTTWSSAPSGTTSDLATTVAFRVSERVARVEMRVGTAAEPGTWHSSTPEGGFVYVGAWMDAGVPESVGLYVETRAFDVDGRPVDSDLLGRSPLELM